MMRVLLVCTLLCGMAAHGDECLVGNVQPSALSSEYPPLETQACEIWVCPDFRPDPNPLFEPGAHWRATQKAIDVYKLHPRMLADSDKLQRLPLQLAPPVFPVSPWLIS